MSIFDLFKKKKKGNGAPKQRVLLSQSSTVSKKPVVAKQASKLPSIPVTAVKTALLPYKEAVVDDIKTLFGVDTKSKRDREAYEAFMSTHFKKEK